MNSFRLHIGVFLHYHRMGTDLTRSEISLIWSSSGFRTDQSIPFANLIRQLIMFNREENQTMIHQCIVFPFITIHERIFFF